MTEKISYHHDFNLGDGWFGNLDWKEENGRYTGTMYVTSEYSLGVSWYSELDEYFADEDAMLEYVERFIKVNNK